MGFRRVQIRKETKMFDFLGNPWFMAVMAVLLVALIGLFFYVRRQQSED
jgi:LPXTG-motif cell wall-anchored protein